MDARTIVAVDIGGTKIACGLVVMGESAPTVESVVKVPTDAAQGGPAVLARVIEQVRAAIERSDCHPVGVGISSAGVVDPRTGDITYANEIMPGWGGTHLAAEVTAAVGLPCCVLNDVHAHALGEARWGGGRDKASCLVVAVGTGIGGAFVERGSIMLGEHDEAGHIGHVCCADGSPMHGAEIDRRAAAGDPAAVAAEARAGRALGEVMGSMCNMLDPSCVILSGSVAQCGPAWSDAMRAGFAEQAMPPVATTPIIGGDLGGDAPLIGAAENFVRSAYVEI